MSPLARGRKRRCVATQPGNRGSRAFASADRATCLLIRSF